MQARGLKRAGSTVPEFIAVDSETSGLFVNHGAKPFLVSLCDMSGKTKAWEWDVDPATRQPKIPRSHKEQIKKELEGKTLVFHNAKFDLRMFAAIDIYFDFYEDDFTTYPTKLSAKQKKSKPPITICCPTFHDTLLASHACSTEDKHGLKELGVKYLGYSDSDERSLKEAVNAAARYCKSHKIDINLGKDPNGDRKTAYDYWLPRFVDPDNDCCLRYALRDVERTILLWGVFNDAMAELDVEEGYQRERKLLKTVYRMETDGISIRTDSLDKKIKELERNIRKQEKIIGKFLSQEGYPEVNLNSNKELPDLLFNQMEYPVVKETKGGNPSTDKDAIEALIEICEEDEDQEVIDGFFVPYLIRSSNQSAIRYLRSYNAFKIGTDRAYADLYPSLNQTGTGTTRFSSSKPNGQNVSKLAEVDIGKQVTIPGSRIRDIFAPRPGKVWYAIDYNQLELRTFAAVSGEDSLIQALAEGYDFHGYVASRIFDKPVDQITKQERRIAKNTNFAIIFGASPRKVNATAGIPNAYELFAGLFPNVHSYMQSTIKDVRKTGYVRTLDGYRLDVPHNAPYKAVNYKVQGTAGSIVKQAMIDIDEEGLVDWIHSRMALQIHDELLIEVDEDSEYNHPSNIYNICRAMENAGAKLGVDTPVSCDIITTDWGHGEEVTVTKTQLKPIKKAA